jgi:glycosyltransferase involved in cell wall biosynthesis
MRFSIIIPSFNQDNFIETTFQNLIDLKNSSKENGYELELALFDNNSNEKVQSIINKYKSNFDILVIEPDKGQYDAINKGISKISGDYWTWLNTDDIIVKEGFLEIVNYLKAHPDTDYIYGDVKVIDENGKVLQLATSGNITLNGLINKDASISQPGSFFRTEFTKKIGPLATYRFAFDYEYILRILKNNGKVAKVNAYVSGFRYYSGSKSGSQTPVFLKEQFAIGKLYGRRSFSFLSFMLRLRIIKRSIFN